jgi:hypothetical protein
MSCATNFDLHSLEPPDLDDGRVVDEPSAGGDHRVVVAQCPAFGVRRRVDPSERPDGVGVTRA